MQVLFRRPADFTAHPLLASLFGDHDATGRTSHQALSRMAEQDRVNLLTVLMGPERLASPVGSWWRMCHCASCGAAGRPPPGAWAAACCAAAIEREAR